MAFWELQLNGIDVTRDMKDAISSLSVEYDTLGPSPLTATIEIQSMSYFEEFFAGPGRAYLTIKMGWSRNFMVTMCKDAEVVVNPEGNAKEYIDYQVTATLPATTAKQEKSKVFPPNKAAVVAMIAAEHGLQPVIMIKDATAIPGKETPTQLMQTDHAFLLQCAKRWNCKTWVDGETKTLYFVDADKAWDLGGTLKKINIDDLAIEYELGYRTDYARNNVASIKWGHNGGKGGKGGQPAVQGSSENGRIVSEQNYNLEFEGVYYKVKPEYLNRIENGEFQLAAKIEGIIASAGSANARAELRQYFNPLNSSHTNKDQVSAAAGSGAGMDLQVELNVGDPYLRPPRKARIFSGSNSPRARAADLPGFIVNSNSKPGTQIFYIRKVKTAINNGMLRTSMDLTR